MMIWIFKTYLTIWAMLQLFVQFNITFFTISHCNPIYFCNSRSVILWINARILNHNRLIFFNLFLTFSFINFIYFIVSLLTLQWLISRILNTFFIFFKIFCFFHFNLNFQTMRFKLFQITVRISMINTWWDSRFTKNN
jgi:hypothetical protein